ncbi:hypothetical protein [Psychromonas sp. SR45-3]|uniref:hypothetical protein n=1 Tax=Psychromonas sp. SR45-3 TaxID=2760930 RepID=UPI001C719091|nr:hypothetical protein [Psychromonas sp. SR45-3]
MSMTIALDVPLLTIPEYARRSGATINVVRKQCDNGQLPFVQNGTGGTRYINMVQLTQRCMDANADKAWN